MARIDVIEYEASEGRLREIYDDLISKRGKLADVHMIQSLNPESIVLHMDLYMGIMFGRSPLKRYQREMMAVVVSRYNDCDYCQMHHGDALNHFWKDDTKIEDFKNDFNSVGLDSVDVLLCELAKNLTVTPNWTEIDAHFSKLKSKGLDDRAILDAHLVIAYFNFVNRLVLGLGVNIEDQVVRSGFNYD